MRPRRVRIAGGQPDFDVVSRARTRKVDSERRRPLLRHIVIAGALVAAGGVVLAVTNLYMALDSDELVGWITPRASAELSRPVTLGEARLSLWPRPSVRMRDIRVENLPGFEGPPLAQIDAARFEVSWLPLIVGRVQVRRLVLEGARLHMGVDEHGASNFGDLVPSGVEPQEPLPASVALSIGKISLSGGSLTYFDAHGGRSMAASGIDAEALLAPGEDGGWGSTVAARSDSLLVRFAGIGEEIIRGAGPTVVILARGGVDPGTVRIDEGHLAFAKDTLAVYGALSLGGRRPGFDLLFTDDSISAGFLTAFFPRERRPELLPRVERTLDVMVQVTGGAEAGPALRGSVRLEGVGVRIRGEPLIEGVSGLLALSRDTIAFDSLAGRFAGGPFELSGTVARAPGGTAFVARGEPDLDTFDRLGLLPEGSTLSGDAKLYLSIAGPSASFDSLEVIGAAGLTGFQLEHPRLGAPVYIPSGEISLVGREARWSDLTVLLGHDSVLTSGSLLDLFAILPRTERIPRVDVSLAARRLDLTAMLPPRDTTSQATYAQLAIAHLGGQALDGQTAATLASARGLSRPVRLPAHGSVELTVDTLLLRQRMLGHVSARVELGESAVSVPRASFEAWGGQVDASLQLGIGSESDEPFALQLQVEQAEAERFFAATSPIGDAITGTLDLRLDVQGATDSNLLPVGQDLTGDLEMTIVDGHIGGTGVNLALADFLGDETWEDVAFGDWAMDIRILDRTLDIREASLAGDTGDVVFSGPLRLDGSADLSMGLSIPSQHLQDVSLRRTGIAQSVLDQLRAAGGSLDIGLRLSGWLQAPTLEPDASNAVALAH
jgi:hypothetical protein